MGAKYSTVLVGGVVQTYNDNPPSDDGSQTEANRVKFATITSDLTAPLHSAITAMDAKIVDLVDEGPTTKSGAYTTIAGDYGKVIEGSGSFTLSLLNPSGNAGYKVTVKNAGAGTITVNVDGGANVDGAASQGLAPGQAAEYRVNAAGTAYFTDTGPVVSSFTAGTAMVFFQVSAPTGWTISAANNDKALRVVSGSGGGTGGTHGLSSPPSSAHTHTGPSHTHPGPSHTHSGPSHNHQWNVQNALGTDQSYDSGGSLANLTSSSDSAGFSLLTGSGVSELSANLYTSNAGTGATGAAGTGATGAAGDSATSSDGPTAFSPQYIDVIVCTKD